MAYFFYDHISLLIQLVLNWLMCHGVMPLDSQNVVAGFMTLLTRAAAQAAAR
jgi:hypothetical protein